MSPNRNSPGRSLPDLMIGNPNPLAVKWAALRFQHTTAIRSRLMETYAAATINRILSALRGTLKAAWRLEQMTAEDYHRAVDIKSATSSLSERV